jgi:flavin-dependent dehydrogenase
MYDLIVSGGGPAGSSAAISAAQGGAKVLLLERGRFPRHKVCGEFVSAESLALLKSLLDFAHTNILNRAIPISCGRMFIDGRILQTAIDPNAASITRFDLDSALWDSASSCGVDTISQTTVLRIDGTGPFQVSTSAGRFEAQAVINASGRWSNLNPDVADDKDSQQQKKAPKKAQWLGLKSHFAEPSPSPSVDLYFFAGGYCGVQPVAHSQPAGVASHVNACAMVRAEAASTIDEVLALHPALLDRSRKWESCMTPVSTSPLRFRKPQPALGNLLNVGDAAAFVDPFIGDGISLALRSGAFAAAALIPFFRGEASLPESASVYRESYEEQLTPVFQASSKIRQMLLWPRAVRWAALSFLQGFPALTRYLVRQTR